MASMPRQDKTRRLGVSAKAKTKLAYTTGNSHAAQLGRKYQTMGLTKSVITQVKRRYYRAGLRLDKFTADSFTPEFKSDALLLASAPFNFNMTMQFITKYGNYIYDSATMGASLYRMFFFSQESSTQQIKDVEESKEFVDTQLLYKHQRDIGTSTTHISESGLETVYSYTNVERIGEFNTGGPSATLADGTLTSETCAIGATIAPQIIERGLKPLWFPDIPLELFMTNQQAVNFREYLYNTTNAQFESGNTCADVGGENCYEAGGLCLPTYNEISNVYNFTCRNPEREGSSGTYQFEVYVLGLGIRDYYDPQAEPGIYPTWWGHHLPNFRGKPAYGVLGCNQARIFPDKNSQTYRDYCPTGMGSNYLTAPNPVCDPHVFNNFTTRTTSDKDLTVKIELWGRNTRDCVPGPDILTMAEDVDGTAFNCGKSDSESFKPPVKAYSQPSMGVVVCPRAISKDDSTQSIRLSTCYYVFKWVAGEHFTPQTYKSTDGGNMAYLLSLDGRPQKMITNKEWGGGTWAATQQPVTADRKFVTLTLDLNRQSPVPKNIATSGIQPGLVDHLAMQTGVEYTISYDELIAKLNLGLDTYLG